MTFSSFLIEQFPLRNEYNLKSIDRPVVVQKQACDCKHERLWVYGYFYFFALGRRHSAVMGSICNMQYLEN